MKYLFTLSITLLSFFAQAQEKRKSVSINYGLGEGNMFRFAKVDGGSFADRHQSLRIMGIGYANETGTKNLYWETGLHYFAYDYKGEFEGYGNLKWEENKTVKLLSIPIKLRYELGKYIFFNGGLYADVDISKDPDNTIKEFTGLGAGFGLGLHYYLEKIGVFVNPQIDARNLLSFTTRKGPVQRLFNTNLSFGVALKIN